MQHVVNATWVQRSCELPSRTQVQNPGGVYQQSLRNHIAVLRLLRPIYHSGMLQPFTIIYKEFILFTYTDLNKLQVCLSMYDLLVDTRC